MSQSKNLLTFVFLTVLTMSFSIHAQQKPALVSAISETSRKIRLDVQETQASDKKLQEALLLLEEALDLINVKDDGSSKKCFDFAYAKYYQSHSSATAAEKAASACKMIGDMAVVEYAYPLYYQSLSASSAMDKAATAAEGNKGKLEIIKFAYQKYYQSSSASDSIDKASQGARKVSRHSQVCVEDLYKKFYQSMSASESMNKAFEACKEN